MLPDTLTALHAEAPGDTIRCSKPVQFTVVAVWKAAEEPEKILEECRSVCWLGQRGADYTAHRKKRACSLESSERVELPGEPDNDALDFHIQE